MRSRGLNKKHQKALELLKTTDLTVVDIARQSGISETHLRELLVGSEHAGPVAAEFSTHYQKAKESTDKDSALATSLLRNLMLKRIAAWADLATKDPKKMTQVDVKHVIDILSVLKQHPTYNIGSVSYSRGLSPEDMVNEFKRLSALAESALNRGRVPGPREGRPGVLPPPSRRGDKAQKSPETTSLPAEPEAGTLS